MLSNLGWDFYIFILLNILVIILYFWRDSNLNLIVLKPCRLGGEPLGLQGRVLFVHFINVQTKIIKSKLNYLIQT